MAWLCADHLQCRWGDPGDEAHHGAYGWGPQTKRRRRPAAKSALSLGPALSFEPRLVQSVRLFRLSKPKGAVRLRGADTYSLHLCMRRSAAAIQPAITSGGPLSAWLSARNVRGTRCCLERPSRWADRANLPPSRSSGCIDFPVHVALALVSTIAATSLSRRQLLIASSRLGP